MPMQKARLHRLMRIVAQLKENRYPNSDTLVKEFRRIAVEEDLEIDCGKKTILRDMKVLENEFGCPLAFDRARNGYYLKHHGWDFIAPAILDENEMLAAVVGARIAEEIFPPPLKNRIREAVDYLLQAAPAPSPVKMTTGLLSSNVETIMMTPMHIITSFSI